MIEGLERKSEKRLHKRLARAEKYRNERRLSLKSGDGKLIIAVSRVKSSHDLYASKGKEPQYFRLEAERLQEERSSDHQEVILRDRATLAQMKKDFGDPEVSDIILIGNGTLNALPLDSGQYFDWWAAARAAVTLKRGKVEQRMCGNFPSEIKYHVPLGTFAVSDLRNLTAATGKIIPDLEPPDEVFQPVFSSPDDPIGQIQDLNNRFAGRMPIIIGDNRQPAGI